MAIIQKPDALSMLGNMKKFIVSSGSQISFELKEGSTVLLAATYEPGTDGKATIDVKDIIESRLKYNIQHTARHEQTEIVKTFTAVIDGASSTFKVIRAGVANLADTPSNWLRGNFLTWQPQNKKVTYHSPEWLTYYAQEACSLKLKAYFPDDTVQNINLGACEAGKAFTFNLQYALIAGSLGQKYPTHYDVWAETAGGARLTYIQRYLYSDPLSEQEQWFLFENSLGGLDTIRAYGDTDFTGNHDHKLSTVDDLSSEYDIDTERTYNKNTGFLDEYERKWLLDYFPAKRKYIYHSATIRSIVVKNSDVKYSASDLPSSYNFNYKFSDAESSVLLNLIRDENIPASITIPNLDAPDFHLPPRLSEYPRVPLHEGVILPAFDPHSDEAKVTTVGAILAAAVAKVLQSIEDGEGGGELVDILRVDSSSEPSDFNVFSAARALIEMAKVIQDNGSEYFLSKINPDTAQGLITFLKGVEVGAFTPGALGSGAAVKMVDGTSYAEVDNLTVRQKATFRELIIESLKHIGGQLVLTPARMKCVRVVDGGSFYKCYFDTGDGEVSNEFVAGDLARCQVFTGNGTKFYWRLVTLVGEDWINISKTSAAVGSDAPEAGDDITQLGNATDTTRQSAIILSTVGIDAPSWKQYSGINSFSLEGKETTVFSKLGNRIQGETVFTSGGSNLDDYLDSTAQDILDALKAAQDAEGKAQQAIEDAEASVATINAEVGKLQDQLDGKVSNWFYDYTPTLSNYPASDWDTTLLKDSHIGDTFTNTAPAPAENAGKSWRFVKNGSTYSWTVIADSDAVKALLEASKAQATADGKSTTHLFQPTKYKLGDMWVLNADQTVNGTAYKQGEILTATQDSVTYNQAHWMKRVRYTDDTAVENLEIGGRNLLIGSTDAWKTVNAYSSNLYIDNSFKDTKLEAGQTYVFSWETELLSGSPTGNTQVTIGAGVTSFLRDIVWTSRRIIGKQFRVFTPTETHLALGNSFMFRWWTNNEVFSFRYRKLKLEKGNKPSADWTPAPEDVEIGGRNLLINSKNYTLSNPIFAESTATDSGMDENFWIITLGSAYLQINIPSKIAVGESFTFSLIHTRRTLTEQNFQVTCGSNIKQFNSNSSVQKLVFTAVKTSDSYLRISRVDGGSGWTLRVDELQIEKSHKATDWTPAPEDVEASIDAAKQEAADALAKANTSKAITDRFSGFNGGLATAVIMEMREPSTTTRGDATGFISGMKGDGNLPFMGAGRTTSNGVYADAIAGTAKAIIRHDGSSKFEETQVSGSVIAKQGNSGMQTWLDSSGIRVFNDTGQINIRFGMKNGYAVLEYYDNDGKFLYDLGPNGIMKMEVREEKWTVFKRIFLGTNITTILNSTNRNKYKMSWQQTETTYYVYTSKISAGLNQDPLNDGAVFTSMNKTGARMPLGFYCRKMPAEGVNMQYPNNGTNAIVNSRLPNIQSGNENVYDRNIICFMDLEYYINGVISQTNYYAYWNVTPQGYPEI